MKFKILSGFFYIGVEMKNNILIRAIATFIIISSIILVNYHKANQNKTNNNYSSSSDESNNIKNNEIINEEKEIDENKISTILTNMQEKDITFDSKKINVYLFWGDGCPHCHDLGEMLASLDDNYNTFFNLYSFEVWNNLESRNLMKRFADAADQEVDGVPFLIIGEKVFVGYIDSMENEIKETIKAEYNKTDHFDYYRELK